MGLSRETIISSICRSGGQRFSSAFKCLISGEYENNPFYTPESFILLKKLENKRNRSGSTVTNCPNTPDQEMLLKTFSGLKHASVIEAYRITVIWSKGSSI